MKSFNLSTIEHIYLLQPDVDFALAHLSIIEDSLGVRFFLELDPESDDSYIRIGDPIIIRIGLKEIFESNDLYLKYYSIESPMNVGEKVLSVDSVSAFIFFFVVFHEVTHYIHGHFDAEETYKPKKDFDHLDYYSFEYDADNGGLKFLITLFQSNFKFDRRETIEACILTIYWRYRVFSERRDSFVDGDTHPRFITRLSYMIYSVLLIGNNDNGQPKDDDITKDNLNIVFDYLDNLEKRFNYDNDASLKDSPILVELKQSDNIGEIVARWGQIKEVLKFLIG